MERVGIAKLKNRLSHYVREVKKGKTVLVMDREEAVAQLVPPPKPEPNPDGLDWLREMVARGEAKYDFNQTRTHYPMPKVRIKGDVPLSELFARWKDED